MKTKKPVGRPIGAQVPAVLECLARLGPSTCRQISDELGYDVRTVAKLLRRCEYRELTKVEEPDDIRIHRVAPGWRLRLETRDWRPDLRPEERPRQFKTPAVNSIFAMSA